MHFSRLISAWEKNSGFCSKYNEFLDFQKATVQCEGSLSAVQPDERWSIESVLVLISQTSLEDKFYCLK